MRMSSLLISILSVVFLFFGCSTHEDPDYYVTVNGVVQEPKDINYFVPVEGGTYTIAIKGGSTLYPNNILEGTDNPVWTNHPESYGKDWDISSINLREEHFVGKWYDVYFKDGEGLVVKISPNDTGVERSIYVEMGMGDYGRGQILRQLGK